MSIYYEHTMFPCAHFHVNHSVQHKHHSYIHELVLAFLVEKSEDAEKNNTRIMPG